MQDKSNSTEQRQKNTHTVLTVFFVVIFMVALSFAAVPAYRLFCQVTGFGGTPQISESLPNVTIDRNITVKFNADTNAKLPWQFKPEQREIQVKLGQRGITAYHAQNVAQIPVTGTAIYNVTPLKAGKYFHKIQCFCFEEQTLNPGEDIDMPVLFYVDPALNDDPNMQDITTITLSYTFFPADSKALEDALEAYYNDTTEH